MSRDIDDLVADFQVDSLRVVVHRDRQALGASAARGVAEAIAARQASNGLARVIFAAAPSQNEFLDALVESSRVDWSKVVAYHMDEYLGLSSDQPASFRRYLREHLFDRVGLSGDRLKLIPGEQADRPLRTCLDYEEVLRAGPADLVCAGIGENGHLAFNDPPAADFLDPVLVKVVRLDHACRVQQLHDGCFATLEQVPTHAYTLTIPALTAAAKVSLCVPGSRKAEAVRTALQGPIDESCPASILRKHPGATLHLDKDSARLIL